MKPRNRDEPARPVRPGDGRSRRHRWILARAGAALVAGLARARVAGRPARIAWPACVPITQWPPYAAFAAAMRERGWIEGTDYIVDTPSDEGDPQRIPAVVAELMSRRPDLIVGSGTAVMRPLMQATKAIPEDKALGLTLPQSLLLRATEVVE